MEKIIALDLTKAKAKKLIVELAKDSDRVFITLHAEKRMEKRKIIRTQIMRCLKHGRITEGPYKDIKGNWKLTIETISAGDSVAVVAALDRDKNGDVIVVITCY